MRRGDKEKGGFGTSSDSVPGDCGYLQHEAVHREWNQEEERWKDECTKAWRRKWEGPGKELSRERKRLSEWSRWALCVPELWRPYSA